MRDLESLDVLFLVVQMSDKTQVVGRSRHPAGERRARCCRNWAAGGHATAGSAATRDITYLQARERLIDILKHHIKPGPHRARHHDVAGQDDPCGQYAARSQRGHDALQRERAARAEGGNVPGHHYPRGGAEGAVPRSGEAEGRGVHDHRQARSRRRTCR